MQRVWVDGELVDNPSGLTANELRTLKIWRRKEGDCPYCLVRLTFDRFATFLSGTKKKPVRLSTKMMECPACHQKFRMSTLIKITDMSVQEFAYWFWENVFLYRMMERVSGDDFFGRIKLWRYEDRNTFWNVYHEFKDTGDRKRVMDDRDAYDDYVKMYEGKVCASCDTVLHANDLEKGECPQCGEEIAFAVE